MLERKRKCIALMGGVSLQEILLDVDGVLRNLIDPFLAHTGLSAMPSYVNSRFYEYWQDAIKNPESAKRMYLEAEAYPGALDAVNKLRSTFPGTQITFLTAAFHNEYPYLKDMTREWLTRNGFLTDSDALCFVSAEEKAGHMRFRPGILFDDNAATINRIGEPSAGVWIHGCYENDMLEAAPNRMTAYSLKDAVDVVCNPAFIFNFISSGAEHDQ